MSLNTRAINFDIVLNIPTNCDKDLTHSICEVLTPFTEFVAVIKHDKDTNEKGELKTLHYHIVCTMQYQKKVSTIINTFSVFLQVPTNCLSVSPCLNVKKSVRYLIHLDDFDKYKYLPFDICSSDIDKVNDYLLDKVNNYIDFETLLLVVKQYNNKIDIMRIIGLDNYKKYRNVIDDIQKELQSF